MVGNVGGSCVALGESYIELTKLLEESEEVGVYGRGEPEEFVHHIVCAECDGVKHTI